MEIKFFDNALKKFIENLEPPAIAKVLRTIDLLEKFGNNLGMPHSEKVSPRLFELRIRGQQEIRILYTFHLNAAILLHGFIKKTDKILKKELRTSLQKLRALDNI